MIELEVVGKHALLFDDDSSSAFINSGSALVDWNSLFIDRYDVRHLLSGPIPPRIRRKIPFSGETEIDEERYRDLKDNDFQNQHQECDVGAQAAELGGFHSVAFSYGNPVDSNDQKNHNDGAGDSGYRPPFPIPDSLLQCLPPTEKVHQIMARTALFVSKNGGQSEIVLRVKQGDNPTFGFLMPDHHLHPYFRYLVDHQDLLMSDMAGKSENNHTEKTSGALSLLGSVYGSGDDEEAPTEDVVELKQKESMKTVDAGVSSFGRSSQENGILAKSHERDEVSSKPSNFEKEKIHVLKKSSLMKFSKAGIPSGRKKGPQSTLPSATVNMSSCSASVNASTAETVILEPPSDVRKLVTRVVEFILKNGPQFEAVLTEQDSKYGRFPFLLPSNQFHSYYANVLREAQESKLSGKSYSSEKNDRVTSRLEKKLSLGKASASSSLGTSSGEIPFDSDRKEKFKMVLGKSKKDGDEPSSRIDPPPYGYTIDAAQTAAILQAATRGVKNTHFVPNISLNGDIHNEARVEAAAEANMTKEQKLKAERLKRAKMFVSMLKTGSAPSTRAFSMEPQLPMASAKESEDILVKKDEPERKLSDSEIQERISRRKYRSRPSRSEDSEEKDEVKDEEEEEKGKNVKHYSKKRPSHRSLRESDKEVEEDQENTYYRHAKRKHRSHRSSRRNDSEEEVRDVEENRDYQHGKRKPRSCDSGEEEEEQEDENVMDHRHVNRKHRTHRSSRETDMEEDEGDRDYRRGKRKHRSYRTSREDEEEEELEDGDKRDRKKVRKKHRSRHSSDEDDGNEKDYKNYRKKHRARHSSDEDDGNGRDYKNYRKKHRSHHSSDDEDDNDNEDNHCKHSKKRHRAHHSSRRSKDKYKHKERHTSLRNRSPDDEDYSDGSSGKGRSISPSAEDLEEGEIISKVSDQSRASVGGDASREASIDVSSSQRDDRAPSQPLEASEVPDELRAKIRAMLMSNF